MAFQGDFMKAFKAGLEPYGFKRMKGTNYFGKLINDEILLYITYQKYTPPDRGKMAFGIISGAQSIFSYDLWEHQLYLMGLALNNYGNPICNLVDFKYNSDDDVEMVSAINNALDMTLKVAVPELLKISDINSYIDFIYLYNRYTLSDADKFWRDSVLLIMTQDHEDTETIFQKVKAAELARFGGDPENPKYKEQIEELYENIYKYIIKPRDMVWASPELQEKLQKEVEHRVENNKTWLIKYGLLSES